MMMDVSNDDDTNKSLSPINNTTTTTPTLNEQSSSLSSLPSDSHDADPCTVIELDNDLPVYFDNFRYVDLANKPKVLAGEDVC